MKTRSKIILIFTSILVGIVLVFSISIYIFISNYAFNDFYKRLEIRAYSTAWSELDGRKESELIRKFKGQYLEPLLNEKHYIFIIKNENSYSEIAQKIKLPIEFIQKIKNNNIGTYRENSTFYSGISYRVNEKYYFVITSATNYYYIHHIAYLRNLMIVSILLTTVLVLLIAYWFSKKLITPLQEITLKVNKIGTENLNIRLEGEEKDDELGDLIRTFNSMLDRLETSFETQNNFISNASHELNTPLTSIIGEADVTLARLRSTEEYIESLHSILEEAEKLDKKIKALLYLAQTAFNGKALKMDKVRIDQLILDVRETMNRIIPLNKITLDFSLLPDSPEKLKILGNEQLLHLALSNVIVNAVKYSKNQEVKISLYLSETQIIISVHDKGVGIPEKEIQYIYDPFFRASNTGTFEGYGIGLSLTRNIVKIHQGQLHVNSVENQGTGVDIKLPMGNFKL